MVFWRRLSWSLAVLVMSVFLYLSVFCMSVSVPVSHSLSVREEKTERVSLSASPVSLCRFSASCCYVLLAVLLVSGLRPTRLLRKVDSPLVEMFHPRLQRSIMHGCKQLDAGASYLLLARTHVYRVYIQRR